MKELQAYQIGSKATGGLEHLPHGFMTLLWDRTQGNDGKLQTEAVAAAVLKHHELAKTMNENLMIMFNNGNDLEVFDRTIFRQNLSHLQTGITASAAGGTCGAAIIIQRRGNFLSGEYDRSSAKLCPREVYKEDCYARATVAFSPACVTSPYCRYPRHGAGPGRC